MPKTTLEPHTPAPPYAGAALKFERIDNEPLWAARIRGRLVGAAVNPCDICALVRTCDECDGHCSILS